ncbi:MAG: LamG-like jellyroll fold domain-containing protein [Opitutales bacterium]
MNLLSVVLKPLGRTRLATIFFLCMGSALTHAEFAWQKDYAKVLPQGELEWAPEPYAYDPGEVIRYIDFESGDDRNDGTSKTAPWKHHPWDPDASARAAAARGSEVDTYVFKGGVIYRGTLRPRANDGGTAANPVRLTRDPSWGAGLPFIYGSERVTDWQRGAHSKMDDRNVWYADVPFRPRTLWQVEGNDIQRLILARDPNWTESDPNDPMAEWPTWDQPEWWKDVNKTDVPGKGEHHLGIDKDRLGGFSNNEIEGATVWTEWGIVMGSPYPARVEKYERGKQGVAFRGPWTWNRLEKIITGNRYYLENKPQWLDQDGEFWVEPRGEGARIYARLPDGSNPNNTTMEAGHQTALIKSDSLAHVEIAGLAFRFTNVAWEYDAPRWATPNLRDAVLRIAGSADGIHVRHCVFEHVNMPVRITAEKEPGNQPAGRLGTIVVRDNLLRDTDHGGIYVQNHEGKDRNTVEGPLEHVEILRNKLERIGFRILSGEHGHAIDVVRPKTSIVAGNLLYRIAGWGISVTGGKGNNQLTEIPFNRHLIKHNRVEDVLLKSNDWGGIETWQGGAFYTFNNVVINPRGFKNWIYVQGDKARIPAFGHAYYLDGSFKNYLFNNIAIGLNNEPGGKYANSTALQNIISFQNYFVNNTFYKFGETTRQQAPGAGRFFYLGNVIQDSSIRVFRHANSNKDQDPNADHFRQGSTFDHETTAYANNIIYDMSGQMGVFESHGRDRESLTDFAGALEEAGALVPDVGLKASQQPIADPEGRDFRASGSAIDQGVTAFMPWNLYAVVGEWNFYRNSANAQRVIDEHWYMTPYYVRRQDYKDTPRYPLMGVNIEADDFVMGALEDWTAGALRLNGTDQYLSIAQSKLAEPVKGANDRSFGLKEKPTVDVCQSDFIIEAVLRTQDDSGIIAQKVARAGYSLDIHEGTVRLRLRDAEGNRVIAVTTEAVNDGGWKHILAEVHRESAEVRLYVNGALMATEVDGDGSIAASLRNDSDFFVGGAPGQSFLQADLDFLRVSLGTLADAKTSIEELYAWQTNGPQFRDFSGQEPTGERRDAGAVESTAGVARR